MGTVSVVMAALLSGVVPLVPAGGSEANAGATFSVPVTPCRVVDTRVGAGGEVRNGAVRSWQVSGSGVGFAAQGGRDGGCGIPSSATAVELSISAAAPKGTGFLRAGPSGGALPRATVLQFSRSGGATNSGAVGLRPNVVEGLTVTGHGASSHVVVDVLGYALPVSERAPVGAATYVPRDSCRVVDTRAAARGALRSGEARTWQVLGDGPAFVRQGGRPGGCFLPFTANAVVLSISAVGPEGTGFLRAWAAGTAAPTATVAQFTRGASTTNTVTVQVTPDALDNLSVRSFSAGTHVTIDVQGHAAPLTQDLVAGSSVFVSMAPCRVADTRTGGGRVVASSPRGVRIAGTGAGFAAQGGAPGGCGIPATATAVTASISAIDPAGNGLIRTGIYGEQIQSTVLQYRRATGTTNTGATTLLDRQLTLQVTGGATHVAVDVSGYYLPQPTPYIGAHRRITDASTSTSPSISADGRFVAYLVRVLSPTPAPGGRREVWLWDRSTSSRTRVSDPTGDAADPSISADGGHVAYTSTDSTLVAGDTNGVSDVFVWERSTGATVRVSASTTGVSRPVVSGDGSHVVFESADDDPTPNPDYEANDGVFGWDRSTGLVTRISPITIDAAGATISADGRHVAYAATALPGQSDVYSWDRTDQTTIQVSGGEGQSIAPSASGDGRYIAYYTDAPDPVTGDAGFAVWDRVTGTRTRGGAFTPASGPVISQDGRYVSYVARLPSFDPINPSNDAVELAVWDRTIDATFRLTGSTGGGNASSPSVSADGRYIAFDSDSDSPNLVTGDTNGSRDVFIWDRLG